MNSEKNVQVTSVSQHSSNEMLAAVKCLHSDVKFTEEIAAMHQIIFEGNNFYKNNEYGNRIKIYCECYQCGKRVAVTDENQSSLPKWIKSKIQLLKNKKEWWLT